MCHMKKDVEKVQYCLEDTVRIRSLLFFFLVESSVDGLWVTEYSKFPE